MVNHTTKNKTANLLTLNYSVKLLPAIYLDQFLKLKCAVIRVA